MMTVDTFQSDYPIKNGARVVAVVVTYQRKALLKECLEALRKQHKLSAIVVVDNASTDGTDEYIKKLADGSQIIYINTGENIGGAGGFNLGIKEAAKLNCDHIWLMDDDCIVGEHTLDGLLNCAERLNGDFGFLSSAVQWIDGSVCRMNVQRSSIACEINDFKKQGQSIKFASFVSLFLNIKAVYACGLPIKEFFIWGDDWEYTSRISKKFKNYFVPESVVTHKSFDNAGSDIVADSSDRIGRYFYAYRNEKYLFDRLGLAGRLYYFLKVQYHRLKLLLSNSSSKKLKLDIIKKGLKAAKSFKPQIEFLK